MLKFLKQYFPIRNVLFVLLEGIVIFSTFLITSILMTISTSYLFDIMLFFRIFFVSLICLICLYYNDLYNFDQLRSLPEMSVKLLQALGVSSILLGIIYYLFPLTIIDDQIFILSIILLIFFITGWRLAYFEVLNKGLFNENIILIGSSNLSKDIFSRISNTLDCGYNVLAIFPDDKEDEKDMCKEKICFHYDVTNLFETASTNKIKKIVVALKEKRGSFPMDELIKCKGEGLEVIDGCSFYEQLTGKILVERINPSWLIFSDGFKKSFLRKFIKRSSDIIGSIIILVLLLPFLAIIAIIVKLDSRGPIFFTQERVGKNKKEFTIYKYRSMVENAEKKTGPVWADKSDKRITRVGKFLRKFRIDELPQLWNVLKGEMSLVGPRPERRHFTEELEKHIPFYSQRFIVKPGITGWAQISYSYGATIEDAIEKLNYDLFYIKNMTTIMDIIIILRTIKIVLFGSGAR